MFSGIVEEMGTVASLKPSGAGARLAVATGLPAEEMGIGDSISVSGACLTVAAKAKGRIEADVSAETLSRTTLGSLKTGSKVNLERALTLAGRLGGHLVYGHVDGTGRVKAVRAAGESRVFHITADPSIMKYLVFKGAVAVDGVSLTISAIHPEGFDVALIPITLIRTTFGALRPGDAVNLETDIVGKYVLRFLEGRATGLTAEFLKKHGFA